jgi:hypothetical protein
MSGKKTRFQEYLENFRASKGMGNLMQIEDLEPADMARIAKEVFGLSKKSGDQYGSYIKVLSKYGVMCPHPLKKRLYEGIKSSDKFLYDYRWYSCEMCGCSVINEHWIRARKELEKIERDEGLEEA